MRKLNWLIMLGLCFSLVALADEGTVATRDKLQQKTKPAVQTPTDRPVAERQVVERPDSDAERAARIEFLKAEHAKNSTPPTHQRSSTPNLDDDPVGSCCYSYFGYNYCAPGVTQNDCDVFYGGFQWTENGDCSECPPTVLGRCCYEYDGYCSDGYSQYDCEYYGGVWGEGLACADEPPCFEVGRCCYDYSPYCTDYISEAACYNYYGGGGGGELRMEGNSLDATWTAGLTCADEPTCYPPVGRCCDFYGNCNVTNEYECLNYYFGGVWTEDGTCDDPCPLPPQGRCCDAYGYCGEMIEYDCLNYYFGGVWTEGATCADPCPVLPQGRCCYNNSLSCLETTEAGCGYYGGVWTEGLNCTDNPCPEPEGRCCYGPDAQNPLCNVTTPSECEILNGTWTFGLDCNAECPVVPGALRVITVPVPSSLGVSISADCRGDLYYTNYGEGILHKMDEFGSLISSTPILDASNTPRYIDELGWDESRQVFWGGELNTNVIWTVDRNGLATYQFPGMAGIPLTDGLDYNSVDGEVWHSTDVSSEITRFSTTGLLLGTLTLLNEFNNPEGGISGIEMGAGGTVWAGNSGIDDVRRCDKVTGAFISRFDAGQVRCEGMECDAINFAPNYVLWVKDAYNNTVTAFQIDSGSCVCSELPDTCLFPYQEVDHGDLAACNYPTLINNPAHGLSGIAWLGDVVDGEVSPDYLNADQLPEDDGVLFVDLPWNPCQQESLWVEVTGGQEYGRYAECGGRLYLNAWKDGNLDGDFCDEIPCDAGSAVSEWLIHDVLVTPGVWPFEVTDPGVLNLGRYDGVFRFRLTSTPVGRYGFGLASSLACTEQCGTFAFDILGEVEDYIIADGQLDVELSSFELVPGNARMTLNWSTASETDNHHFEVLRDGVQLAQIASQGNTAAGHSYVWTDEQVTNGTLYIYSLVAVDLSGAREVLATESATPSFGAAVITEYALHPNFPNPFNPTTSLRFDLVDAGHVTLKVFNVQGQEIATLINGMKSAGAHTINFEATGLPSGMYFARLEANGFTAQQKMMLLK